MNPGTLLAHGVGSRGSLPLPLWQFSWAASAALILSFIALGVLWKSPRLQRAADGHEVPGSRPLITALTWIGRIGGMALFALTLAAALFGTNNESANLAPVTIYVVVWVGVAVVSGLVGDVWRAINPFRTIGMLFPETRSASPPHHHHWATGVLFGFLVLELAHPSGSSPRVLGWAMLVYAAIMIGGMVRYGRSWLDSADGFGVLFSLLGAMAPFFVDSHGSLRVRLPLAGLHRTDVRTGTSALILTVLGGTSFDGFSESSMFTDIVGRPTGWNSFLPNLVGLMIMILIASILYWLGAKRIAQVTGLSHEESAEMFAPSLVPILLGYAVAHYAQLLIDETQSFWFRLSNPFGSKDAAGNNLTNWFGTADGQVDLMVIDPDVIAWIQALAIVFGHLAGVLFAHDLAVTHFDQAKAARSQQTMLLVMVVYSVAGLWLLFAG